MVIAPDNLVTFDVGALRAIEDENRGDGKLCKTFAAQVQRRQFWALCLPVTGFCGTDPVAAIDEYSVEGQAGYEIAHHLASIPTQRVLSP